MDEWREVRPISKVKGIIVLILIVTVGLVVLIGSSVTYIGGDEVGIVEKKFGGGPLAEGKIIAANGENGIQAKVLAPGWHLFYWPWQYNIVKEEITEIQEGYVGILQAADGKSLPPDTIYAPEWEDPDKMIDAQYFLTDGNGYRGPQLTVLKPSKYRLNTKLFTIKKVPVVDVKTGTVAVIKSNVGEAVDSVDRLVEKDKRGIWQTPLTEGQYYLNTDAYEVTMMDIRQKKVSYTASRERGESTTQPLRPIMVRSSDGYTFPVDVRVNYYIKPENAPIAVAQIGDDELVLEKLVTPAVRSIFRNNAEKVKALEYVQNRSEQGEKSAKMIEDALDKYGVTVLAVHIGDVGDEESLGSLLKTQTDREIARQEQQTLLEQQKAAEISKALEKTKQEAQEEKKLATAAYAVQIAEQEKQQRIIDAQAEAEQLKTVAEAKAEAYKKVSEVIGPDNAALLELMKVIADEDIRITPDVMVSGNGGATDALMGTILKDMIKKQQQQN